MHHFEIEEVRRMQGLPRSEQGLLGEHQLRVLT
jgi:hypothetical protein